MTIQDIKTQLGITSLQLNTANDINDKPTQWMRHWDNENRVAVSIHKELVAEIKADKTLSSLGLQKEDRTGEKGSYVAYRIVKYAPAEEVL